MQDMVSSMKELHLQIRSLDAMLELACVESSRTKMHSLHGVLGHLERWTAEGQYAVHDYSALSCDVDRLLRTAEASGIHLERSCSRIA